MMVYGDSGHRVYSRDRITKLGVVEKSIISQLLSFLKEQKGENVFTKMGTSDKDLVWEGKIMSVLTY